MKKLIKLLSVLLLVTLVLVGCSGSDESNAQNVAKELGTELYTVDSKKINDYNALKKIENVQSIAEAMQSNDKTIKSLMTEDGYNILVANRDNTLNTQGCTEGNYTMQVTDLALSKNAYDIKENKAGYYFETKLKFISNKDKTEQTDVGKGYIGLSKENGQWKVSVYKMTVLPKLIEDTLNNK
ncbi:MAG: hypothetical protein K0R54_4109 [Clostridiaceae bacterium]|jgi:hypothetical protein|nr:hypothetical protein [Clostridiaceae bacterium]